MITLPGVENTPLKPVVRSGVLGSGFPNPLSSPEGVRPCSLRPQPPKIHYFNFRNGFVEEQVFQQIPFFQTLSSLFSSTFHIILKDSLYHEES